MGSMISKTLLASAVASTLQSAVAVAACSFELTASPVVQLLPAGEFRAIDGRPKDAPCWLTNAEIAANLITSVAALANSLVVDYEHQTILSEKNGQPAPAAGWFKSMEWREGEGLFATDVVWTDRAKAMIESGEYKYLSPVILYSKKTGAVLKILHVALTNHAAIDGMREIAAVAAAKFASLSTNPENSMNEELLEQLRWLLNMPIGSTADEILAQLNKLADQVKQTAGATAAASFDLAAHLAGLHGEIAALKAAEPDASKYVPITVMQELQLQLAALTANQVEKEVDGLVIAALSDTRLLPVQENWARELGKKNLGALKDYLASAQPIAALRATQTGGVDQGGAGSGDLSESELAVCKSMGLDPEAYKATKDAQAAA